MVLRFVGVGGEDGKRSAQYAHVRKSLMGSTRSYWRSLLSARSRW